MVLHEVYFIINNIEMEGSVCNYYSALQFTANINDKAFASTAGVTASGVRAGKKSRPPGHDNADTIFKGNQTANYPIISLIKSSPSTTAAATE